MKRSKMIKELAQYLEAYHETMEEAKFYAEKSLAKLEELGMSPPQVTIPGKWQSPRDNCVWEEE